MSQTPKVFADLKDDEIVIDDDNPEWTEEDFARALGPEHLPLEVLAHLPKTLARVRGFQKAATKRAVSIRLSAEVVDHFRAGGPGWQTRIDQTLKDVIARKIG
ncbi:MAG: BrnA antitoxin family protein [Caulobacter sp.]